VQAFVRTGVCSCGREGRAGHRGEEVGDVGEVGAVERLLQRAHLVRLLPGDGELGWVTVGREFGITCAQTAGQVE